MYEINDYKYTLYKCKGCGATMSFFKRKSLQIVVENHQCPAYPDEDILPIFDAIAVSTKPFTDANFVGMPAPSED